MEDAKRLLLFIALYIVPLVPATFLYVMFSNNEALVQRGTITLGGPIAAYFVLLLYGEWIFRRVATGRVQDMLRNQRIYDCLHRRVVGEWDIVASYKVDDETKTVAATAVLSVSLDRRLTIVGLVPEQPGIPATVNWTAGRTIVEADRLIYMYKVPAVAPEPEGRGLVELAFHLTDTRSPIDTMSGVWGETGQARAGTIEWRRRKSNTEP